MTSHQLFVVLVALVALQRLGELRLSRRNEARLRKLGAHEHAPGHFRVMRLLHALWLASMILEVIWLRPPLQAWVSAPAALGFGVGQALRYAAIHALGERWTVRVMTVPGSAPITRGIYRHLRHPNYLGVMLEIAALPLLHSAWRSALVFSLANAALLAVRIREEERALGQNGGYDEALGAVRRFWPTFRARSSV